MRKSSFSVCIHISKMPWVCDIGKKQGFCVFYLYMLCSQRKHHKYMLMHSDTLSIKYFNYSKLALLVSVTPT